MTHEFLIVDDSPTVTHALRKTLEKSGIDDSVIETAMDGKEALEKFEVFEPDVVFMDIQMPGLNGEQASSLMMTENPEVKIIVITGMGIEDERVKNLRALGAFEILEKPLHADEIQDVLHLLEAEETGAVRIQ